MAKIELSTDESVKHALADRAKRMTGYDDWKKLDPVLKSVQFLRGVQSRAEMALPAFYLFCGASNIGGIDKNSTSNYSDLILKEYLRFSSLNTITLACRKTFDHSTTGLTGKNFANWSASAMSGIAEYWSSSSKRSLQDAETALFLLHTIFRELSKSSSDLLKLDAMLGRRIGLLIQHANRSAAHLSLENYEFDILDCVHVVAALVLIAEIIRSFDASDEQPDYFDAIDKGSLDAARRLFPGMTIHRLFADINIETQSRLCWQWGVERGRKMLVEQLPEAIGWY